MKPAKEYADSAARYMHEAGSGDIDRCKVAAMLAQANATLTLAAVTREQTLSIRAGLSEIYSLLRVRT